MIHVISPGTAPVQSWNVWSAIWSQHAPLVCIQRSTYAMKKNASTVLCSAWLLNQCPDHPTNCPASCSSPVNITQKRYVCVWRCSASMDAVVQDQEKTCLAAWRALGASCPALEACRLMDAGLSPAALVEAIEELWWV